MHVVVRWLMRNVILLLSEEWVNAHQEVLFGSLGQVLSIRHDALGRDAYLPGVALGLREVPKQVGLVRGLDTLMGLQ